MLTTFPLEILIIILVGIVIFGIIFVIAVSIYNAKQSEEVRQEPEKIKKKADAPELPSKGQEDKPIDEIDGDAEL